MKVNIELTPGQDVETITKMARELYSLPNESKDTEPENILFHRITVFKKGRVVKEWDQLGRPRYNIIITHMEEDAYHGFKKVANLANRVII
jgi:hypothetical protein